jgi:putative addiction module killer protein
MRTVQQTPDFQAWVRSVTDPVAFDAIAIRTVRIAAGLIGDAKSVGGKVSEIRIDVGQGYRLYFTKRGLTVVLLLWGGDKSTQAADIAKAQKMVKDLEAQAKAAAVPAKKKAKRR